MIPVVGWEYWLPLWVFSPVLVFVAFSDFRAMRISNKFSLVGVILFGFFVPFLGFDDSLNRAMIALVCFALCLPQFALGWIGGGDVKFLPVSLLFIPPSSIGSYLFVFGGVLALSLAALLMARRFIPQNAAGPVALASSSGFPMGIPIGVSPVVLGILSQTA